MDVKDIIYTPNGTVASNKQRSLKSLPRVTAAELPQASRSGEEAPKKVSKSEAALGQAEALVNNISGSASSVKSYLVSLNGILEQGLKESSEVRRKALEREANEVLGAIRQRAVYLKAREPAPAVEDPVRSEVEAKIGRTLELLLNEPDKGGKALGEIEFSNKDLIIETQTKILRATQYISSLREIEPKVDETREVLAKAEIAQINAESSHTSLRDVDTAFELVQETSKLIGADAKTALFAVGNVRDELDVQG